MTVFVTGASGFIGQALTRRLARQGMNVRVLIRDPRKGFPGNLPNTSCIQGDLSNGKLLVQAMRECSQVYHLAALARAWAPDSQEFDRTNIEGTENILKAAQIANVERVVHTSTVMALGPTGGFIADESNPFPKQAISHYQRTKIEAEKKVKHFLDQGLSIIIASPSLVFGPGTGIRPNSFNRFLLDFARGRPVFIPGNGSQSLNIVYVEDVVDGLIQAMERGQTGARYILGGENIQVKNLESLIREVTGLKNKVHYVPFWAAKTAGFIEEIRARLTKDIPRFTWKGMEVYKHSWVYSSEKALQELDYHPRPLKEGIAQTCDWIKTVDTQRAT